MTVPTRPSTEAELVALAPLAEPLRRRLYLRVAASPEPMGRDEAAAALGISRALAAFHLDRLVADGLLQPEFQRLSGRTGPGAGRPAKLYRRSAATHEVSLPARNYELAARLFADALTMPGEQDAADRVRADARAYGHTLGRQVTTAAASSDSGSPSATGAPETTLTELRVALTEEGFEPRLDGDVIRLGNCPFHTLAQAHRDLTCGMNLALMSGLLDGLGADGWRASLDPRPGLCCVAFEHDREAPESPTRPAS